MASYFDEVRTINLNSRYDGWIEDVNDILSEIDDRSLINAAVPRLPSTNLKNRLKELRFVCLVDDLTMVETRNVFSPVANGEDYRERNLFDRLYDRMMDAPYSNDEGERPEEEYFDDFPRHMSNDPSNPVTKEPFYGANPDDPRKILVVVDCYGMYTPSLMGWLKAHVGHGIRDSAMENIRDELLENPEKDGPAILLSPDLLKTVYPMIIKYSSKDVRKLLPLNSNPDIKFLKMTFLHELGHHVYSGPTRIFSEAMANWFVYGFLDATDRRLLYEKTKHQSKPYQMYLGFLTLFYPEKFSTRFPDVALPWPFPAGPKIVQHIEMDSFDGFLADNSSPTTVPRHWHNYSKSLGEYYNYSFHLHDLFFQRKKPWDMHFHPLHFTGTELLDEILKQCQLHGKIERLIQELESLLQNYACKSFTPMSRKEQMEWLIKKFSIVNIE